MGTRIISKYSNDILNRIGFESATSIGDDRDGDPIIVGCKRYDYDKLSIWNRREDILITYGDELVFDSGNNYYVPGKWEKLLEYIHLYLEKLEAEKERKAERDAEAEAFFEAYLKRFLHSNMDNYKVHQRYMDVLKHYGIKIKTESEDLGFYEQHSWYTALKVLVNGQIVFLASYCNSYSPSFPTFISGEWMDKIRYVIETVDRIVEEEKRRARDEEIDASIDGLIGRFK